jgi:hypothetical protein
MAPHLVERLLNDVSSHTRAGSRVYNHATYSPERAPAAQTWADRLVVAGASEI